MTLVCHKHKFIYIKSGRTASTSIQAALGKWCTGEKDIVTPMGMRPEIDDTPVKASMILYEEKPWSGIKLVNTGIPLEECEYIPKNFGGVGNHMTSILVKNLVGDKIWNEYVKICSVRNPWDWMVSQYKCASTGPVLDENPSSFEQWVKTGYVFSNENYYFIDGETLDCYVYFENLNDSYRKICERVGIPYIPLPFLHTKHRFKVNKNYRGYYTQDASDIVADRYDKTISFFKYCF